VIVGIVGPCCSGKSTLVTALLERGIDARHIAQEHSFAPSMWKVVGQADRLVFLDVSYAVAQQRRWMDWTAADMDEQQRRLRHARANCDLYVCTDPLPAAEVLNRVLIFLAGASSSSL
jgi:hypothetical protein